MKSISVSASVLAADFLNFYQSIQSIQNAGADFIHVDIMDGHFVPNLTFGPLIISEIKKATNLPIEAHLMIANTEQVIDQYIDAGADIIIVHQESCMHLDRIIEYISSKKVKTGVALNPSTHQDTIEYVLNKLDIVLVMTVNPGFCGQKFLHTQLPKIEKIRNIILQKNLSAKIAVDGGINPHTGSLAKLAGAQVLIAGSYLFKDLDCKDKVAALKSL